MSWYRIFIPSLLILSAAAEDGIDGPCRLEQSLFSQFIH